MFLLMLIFLVRVSHLNKHHQQDSVKDDAHIEGCCRRLVRRSTHTHTHICIWTKEQRDHDHSVNVCSGSDGLSSPGYTTRAGRYFGRYRHIDGCSPIRYALLLLQRKLASWYSSLASASFRRDLLVLGLSLHIVRSSVPSGLRRSMMIYFLWSVFSIQRFTNLLMPRTGNKIRSEVHAYLATEMSMPWRHARSLHGFLFCSCSSSSFA